MNPSVASWSSFDDDFLISSDIVFLEYFLVNRGSVRCRIQASALQAVSMMISVVAAVVCADESIRRLWKLFLWRFLNRHRLRFPRLFMSQQGLRTLMNPCVNSGSCFGNDSWIHSNSVFLYYLCVNRGCVRWRIQASALQAVSVMISEVAAIQFALNIFEWIGAVCTDESKRQLCKQFWWWFLRWRRLSFRWIFLS